MSDPRAQRLSAFHGSSFFNQVEKAKAIPAGIEGTSSAEVVTAIKSLFLSVFSRVFDRQACACAALARAVPQSGHG
jgi:hypothetical protein